VIAKIVVRFLHFAGVSATRRWQWRFLP